MKQDIKELVSRYIEEHGETALIHALKVDHIDVESGVLTIIVNEGIHPLSKHHKRGELFIASSGSLDFSSKELAEEEFKKILKRVAIKLKSHSWEKVFLVPFGPAVLSMLIKNLVYKILYIDTIDVLHAGNGKHYDIEIDLREIALSLP
ncbi:hypothetical protein [Herminiimonas contaminans]|uniref:SMODS-associated and fused to various effectors domain-containing protein n=1 Tax=Herminiimonas contaminans TaxID=1111140 RepID=A0ABS0EWU0_9BURK|nr:hypothetical protein [Herminiimonas contaminans]MBF8179317.1 hypothetical protein [Herminiimonas contaminans]